MSSIPIFNVEDTESRVQHMDGDAVRNYSPAHQDNRTRIACRRLIEQVVTHRDRIQTNETKWRAAEARLDKRIDKDTKGIEQLKKEVKSLKSSRCELARTICTIQHQLIASTSQKKAPSGQLHFSANKTYRITLVHKGDWDGSELSSHAYEARDIRTPNKSVYASAHRKWKHNNKFFLVPQTDGESYQIILAFDEKYHNGERETNQTGWALSLLRGKGANRHDNSTYATFCKNPSKNSRWKFSPIKMGNSTRYVIYLAKDEVKSGQEGWELCAHRAYPKKDNRDADSTYVIGHKPADDRENNRWRIIETDDEIQPLSRLDEMTQTSTKINQRVTKEAKTAKSLVEKKAKDANTARESLSSSLEESVLSRLDQIVQQKVAAAFQEQQNTSFDKLFSALDEQDTRIAAIEERLRMIAGGN